MRKLDAGRQFAQYAEAATAGVAVMHEDRRLLRQPGLDGATRGNAEGSWLAVLVTLLLLLALVPVVWPLWLWGRVRPARRWLQGTSHS